MSKPQLIVTDADDGLELSGADYAEADFQPPHRYERAHGRLVVIPPPGHHHHVVAGYLRKYLGAYEISHPEIVEFVFQESWLSADEATDRHPDIAVYLRSESSNQEIPQRVPDIIFEVVSPGPDAHQRDYVQKRREYESIEVSEYVIVDRFEHRVTVLRLAEGRYQETTLSSSDDYSSPLLPGLLIPLHEIV